MRIINLAGIFTGSGFKKSDGRKVDFSHSDFIAGPLDILIDKSTGKIQSLEKSSPRLNTRDELYDASGLIATAGFLDSHTHALFSGSRSSEYFMRWSGSSYQEIAAKGGGIHNTVSDTAQASDHELIKLLKCRLHAMACLGSTSVEVKSGYGATAEDELRLLRLIKKCRDDSARFSLPRIFATFLGLHALPKNVSETAFVDEMITVLATIESENLADFVDAFPEKGFFSLAQAQRFCAAAAKAGLKAKVHADELSDLGSSKAFAEYGALSVDHLQKISIDGVQALATTNTVATLLPATSFFLGLEYTNARRLIDAGAKVALATDYNPGTAPEYSMPFTLRLAASQLKMSAAEILCATTYNAATALGCQHERGIIEATQDADILLWPTQGTKPNDYLHSILLGEFKPTQVFIRGKSIGAIK